MSDHEAIVREFLVWAESIDRSNDHWWFPDTEGLVETHDALVAERDAANVEWHRIRGLHAAAIADLRVVVAERDAALADLADERNDAVQDKDYIVQLKAEIARLLQEQRYLLAEVDCRIEHGAESNGHLEYVRTYLGATKARRGEAK